MLFLSGWTDSRVFFTMSEARVAQPFVRYGVVAADRAGDSQQEGDCGES